MISHESYAIADVAVVRDFLRKVDDELVRSKPSTFWSAVSGFERIISREVWDHVLAGALARVTSDQAYNGGRDWGVQGFLLAESDAFHFSVRSSKRKELGRNVVDATDEDTRNIASVMAAPSVIFGVASHDIGFNVFGMPTSSDLDVFDPHARIELRGHRVYPPWSRIDIRAPRETLELDRDSSKKCCIVELAMKPVHSQRWEFDRRTGIPVGAVMLSRESVVLRTMLGEIERFRYAPAIAQVTDLINHPDFNIRWACMRCAFAIDPSVGRVLLDRLSVDVNPYVRTSALSILKSLHEADRHAD